MNKTNEEVVQTDENQDDDSIQSYKELIEVISDKIFPIVFSGFKATDHFFFESL
jgi:hypothetical protein